MLPRDARALEASVAMRVLLIGLLFVSLSLAQGQKDLDEANTPHRSADIMKMSSAELVALLEDPNADDFKKAKACQRLGVVGDDRAVPAIAALLGNSTLSHYARTALEPYPGPVADTALREALGRLDGDLLIGVINSIGRRKDPRALDALAKLRKSDDRAISEAAEAALGRIRSP